jgi:hypothetical protein
VPEGEGINAGLEAASWALKHRRQLLSLIKDVRAWFRGTPSAGEGKSGLPDAGQPKPSVLILGPGGTGKTTVGRMLAGEYELLFDALGEYEESLGIESYSLVDDPGVEFVVAPGQQLRREATWPDLHAGIVAGKFRGIILLAPYGYHSLGEISVKQHKLYEGNQSRFLQAYLADRRDQELAVLRELMPHIKTSHHRMWLLTLVGKEDLWWPQRNAVVKYYKEGAYGAEVRNLLGQHDPRRLRHELVFASLVISNFSTARGERLKTNAAGYDQRLQIDSWRRLFETVDALKNWEAGP